MSHDKAITLRPDYAEVYSNRGIALRDLKCSEEALAGYDKAIALRPDYAEAYYNRGVVLQDLKRSEEALAIYDKAIALKPDYAEAYNNRGVALQDLKRLRGSAGDLRQGYRTETRLCRGVQQSRRCTAGPEASPRKRWRATTRRSR